MSEAPIREDREDLARGWSSGDVEVARQVVQLYGPAMLRVALALCPRTEEAEEIVQDAFLLALRSASTFDPRRGDLKAWLVGVTANRARQVGRRSGRYQRFLARLSREPYAISAPASSNGDLGLARRRLAGLPAREREAFVLMDIEDLTSREAAQIMGVSDSTVRVLAARARARLQDSHGSSLRAEGGR